MSDIFGTPDQPAPPTPERGRRVLVPTLVTVAVLIFLGSIFTNIYTDRLWFQSVGYTDVFTKVLLTRIGMFAVFGLVFALFVMGSAYLAWRFRPENPPIRRDDPAFRYRQALSPILRPVTIVGALVLAAFAGSVAQGQWQTFQLWRAGGSFGVTDAHFSRDVGFFVFDYPWFRFLSTFGFTTVVVAFVITAFTLYVFGGIRVIGGIRFSRAAQVQLSVVVGIGLLLRAFGYYLDRFGYAVGNSALFDGIGYTDAMARIPARNVLAIVAIVVALLFFAMIFLKSWTLPGLGLGGLLIASVVIGGIWPYAMQSFQVRPSEPDREGPYIARNIEATRDAYDVADSVTEDYTASTELTPEEGPSASAESRVSSRLLDPTLISDAFQQLQQVRGYYTVPETLDVDRYLLEGSDIPQDVIIAAREVDLAGLQESQRTWSNDHTVYTHGYGVIAAYGNQRGAQGEPVWAVQNIPPVGEIETEIPPRIYFGENSPSYSIVGRPEGADPIEVDIPRGGGDGDEADAGTDGDAQATQNTYDGDGGVSIGSLFHQVLYAVKFNEPNIVLSDRVNENSKVLYDREPRQRVEKVAPWLTVDGDVYPAVVEGRVVWIVDGYTTSNSYPYSEHRSLRTATADTLTQTSAQAALPTDEINYMRNSVKAVVDAYDGSVTLYEWDEDDPILNAWQKVFPGSVEDKSEISEDLMSHLRYPVDLFKVQRDVLARYHVTDAQTFYEDGERWRVPSDPTQGSDSNVLQPPYYLTMSRPGEETPSFSLTSVFLPNSRQNLASFVSVNSEASSEGYGTMQILEPPSDTQVPGPSQIANSFQTDPGVTDALLRFEQSSEARILRGNLLTLPVGGALLYVQPVYIQRSASEGTFPVLQFVAVSFGEDVGFGTTLDEALAVALGLQPGQVPTDDGEDPVVDGEDPPPADTGTTKTTAQWLAEASAAYSAAQDALAAGDLSGYQSKIDEMNAAINGATESLNQPAS